MKEKIGGVRIYRIEGADDDLRDLISVIINEAVIASEIICKTCGTGKLPALSGRCDCAGAASRY
jgi:hypothetical protein